MNKILRLIISFGFIFSFSLTGVEKAAASTISEEMIISDDDYQPIEPIGNNNATAEYVDPNISSEVPAEPEYGQIYEVYSHSTYYFYSKTITGYSVGPLNNQTFLLSVARGSTKTLSHSITVSGTVSYSATLNAGLSKVINLGLTGNASGTVSYTYNTTTEYKGPSAPYNSRDYYSGVNFDNYSTEVKKYNVYNTYNGSIKTGTVTYYAGIVTTKNVKKPKVITYSKDFLY